MGLLNVNWNRSALTIEDLYNPKWVHLYGIYWDATLLITSIFFIFMLYAIIKKSTKEMGQYKWYLCHQLLWSFLFDCHMSLWKPVALWPFYMGYSAGIYSNFSGVLAYIPLFMIGFFIVGMSVSIIMSLMYRYVQACPFSKFTEIYNKKWPKICFYFGIFAFFGLGLPLPMALYVPDFEVIKKSLIEQNSAFEILYEKEPSMFGFDPYTNNNMSFVFLFALLGIVIFLIIFIVGLYFNYIRILRLNKILLSETTYKLQIVLFKALTVQMFFALILLLLPILFSLGLTIFGFQWLPKFCIFALSITATHTLFDFTAIIFFVKVYRNFFIDLFKISMTKIGFKFETIVTPFLPPPSTSAVSHTINFLS